MSFNHPENNQKNLSRHGKMVLITLE